MPTYSPEFKEAVMARMLPPGSESMNRISRETGVCLTTLRKWKQRALGEAGLRERAEGRERQVPSLSRRFQIVAAAAGLSDEELAALSCVRVCMSIRSSSTAGTACRPMS